MEDFEADREEAIEIISQFTDLNISIVGACDDGMSALELIDDLAPDIILCDVQMSYMNGFELLSYIKEKYPQIKFVFCSLYSRMDYYKNALDLDCNGYILKPIDPNELYQCLKGLIQKCILAKKLEEEYAELKNKIKSNIPALAENFIRDLIYGNITNENQANEKMEYFNIDMPFSDFALCLIEIDDYYLLTENLDIELKQIFTMQIYNLLSENLSKEKNVNYIRLNDSQFAFLVNLRQDAIENQKYSTIYRISKNLISNARKVDISLTIITSEILSGMENVFRLYEQCLYMLRFKYSLGKGRIINYNKIHGSIKPYSIDLTDLQKDIQYILNSENKKDIAAFVEEIFSKINIYSEEQLKNTCYSILVLTQIILNENGTSFKAILGSDNMIWEKLLHYETIIDAKDWIKNILFSIHEHFAEKAENKMQRIVVLIKEFIESSSLKGICLESIAENFYYSPNYLNTIFKKETGETISSYISNFRLEKSKELLAKTQTSIFNIANDLGYNHASYFNYVFKKYVGITPKEYRERVADV